MSPDPESTPAADDRDLAKTAYRLTADLSQPNAAIYWADLLLTAGIGYAGFAIALTAASSALAATATLVAIVALYRGVIFIHELAHLRRRTPRYLWTAWHALIGVPLLLPAFFYEGIHDQHHSVAHYGTADDPEYMPLASMPTLQTIGIVVLSALVPLLLLARHFVIAPLAIGLPGARKVLVEKMSGLVMNPAFRRREPPQPRRRWLAADVVTAIFAWSMAALAATGVVPWQALALWLIVWAGIAIVNTLRTVVAHHYTSDGRPMDPIEQLIDTVTVPPPATFPMLWAPVGLRYHGLHHLLPHLPYHALGTAHRRLIAQLPNTSAYRRTVHARGLDVAALLLRNQAQARAWRARGGSPLPGESPP